MRAYYAMSGLQGEVTVGQAGEGGGKKVTRAIADPCRQEKFESWGQRLEVSETGCAKLHDGPLLVFLRGHP